MFLQRLLMYFEKPVISHFAHIVALKLSRVRAPMNFECGHSGVEILIADSFKCFTQTFFFPPLGSTSWAPEPGWASRGSAAGSACSDLCGELLQPGESDCGRDSAAGQSQKHPSALLWGGGSDWEEHPDTWHVMFLLIMEEFLRFGVYSSVGRIYFCLFLLPVFTGTVYSPNLFVSVCGGGSSYLIYAVHIYCMCLRLQRERERLERWLQAAEERAAKEEDLRLLQEEALQQRSDVFSFQRRAAQLCGTTSRSCTKVWRSTSECTVCTLCDNMWDNSYVSVNLSVSLLLYSLPLFTHRETAEALLQLTSSLQSSPLRQTVPVKESVELLERYNNFQINISLQCGSTEGRSCVSRASEGVQALSTRSWTEDARQIAEPPLGENFGSLSADEQMLHGAQVRKPNRQQVQGCAGSKTGIFLRCDFGLR